MDNWESMDNLATWFDHDPVLLTSLKISSRLNDDVEQGSLEKARDGHRLSGTRSDRAGIVARFKGLQELNSSPVSA